MLISIVLLAVYIFTMDIIGFILGTFIFSMLASRVMGYKETLKTLIFFISSDSSYYFNFWEIILRCIAKRYRSFREMSYLIY